MDKVIDFIKKYKWLSLPFALLLFFGLATIMLFSQSQTPPAQKNDPKQNETNISQTPPQQTNEEITAEPTESSDYEFDSELEEPLENIPGFQRKETNPDGTITYYFTSENPSRPNISLVKGEDIIFERVLVGPETPTHAYDYTEPYGQPDKIIPGYSSFYGDNTYISIYEKIGIAFIADNKGDVLEQQSFQPMSSDKFIQLYGETLIKR